MMALALIGIVAEAVPVILFAFAGQPRAVMWTLIAFAVADLVGLLFPPVAIFVFGWALVASIVALARKKAEPLPAYRVVQGPDGPMLAAVGPAPVAPLPALPPGPPSTKLWPALLTVALAGGFLWMVSRVAPPPQSEPATNLEKYKWNVTPAAQPPAAPRAAEVDKALTEASLKTGALARAEAIAALDQMAHGRVAAEACPRVSSVAGSEAKLMRIARISYGDEAPGQLAARAALLRSADKAALCANVGELARAGLVRIAR